MSNHPFPNDPSYYRPPPPPPSYHLHQPPPRPMHPPPLPHPQSYYPSSDSAPTSPYHGNFQAPVPPSFHNSYSSQSESHSSSFESHGSSSHGGAPMPYVGFPPYNQHQGPPPPGFYYPWSPPVEYITNIQPPDVLSGRGGATNSHSGNRAFRATVKQFQERYLQAKKRDKPSVAVEVVFVIRKKGGRFLRRLDAPSPQGEALYYDIGDRRATEKACQALREGAPKLRAKSSRSYSGTSSDDEHKGTTSESSPPHMKQERILTSSSSSFERTTDGKENVAHARNDDSRRQDSTTTRERKPGDEPILIQPSARLLRKAKVEPISVDDLSVVEREIYLLDFVPPNPDIPTSEMKPHADLKPQTYKPDECPPMVSV